MNPDNALNDFLARCARATDFELCSAISDAVWEKYGCTAVPRPDMPVHERVPYLVWSAQGFAEKEGLARLLELEFDRPGWADAYDLIGLPHLAEPLRLLVARLPDPYAGYEEVENHLREVAAELEATEKGIFDQSEMVTRSLAQFIRRQIDRYAGLPAALEMHEGPDLGNIGYLRSAHMWASDFAWQHDDRIPNLAELQAITMHDGLKHAAADDYSLPLAGRRLSGQRQDDILVAFWRPIFGVCYCVTVGGTVMEYRSGSKAEINP